MNRRVVDVGRHGVLAADGHLTGRCGFRHIGQHHGEVVVVQHAGLHRVVEEALLPHGDHGGVELGVETVLLGGAVDVVARQRLVVVLHPVKLHAGVGGNGLEHHGHGGGGVNLECEAARYLVQLHPVVVRGTAAGDIEELGAVFDGGLQGVDTLPATGVDPGPADLILGIGLRGAEAHVQILCGVHIPVELHHKHGGLVAHGGKTLPVLIHQIGVGDKGPNVGGRLGEIGIGVEVVQCTVIIKVLDLPLDDGLIGGPPPVVGDIDLSRSSHRGCCRFQIHPVP